MEEDKIVEETVVTTATPQDPVVAELEKEEKRTTRTEKEKAEFSLKKTAERLKELGGDPAVILGARKEESDEVPEWYKAEKAKETQKTALDLAESVTDENDRKLVKQYLSTRIVPTNPEDDFRLALGMVHAVKNKLVVEEVSRHTAAKTTAAGGSQPIKHEEEFTPTAQELTMMKRPYNLTKEQIIAARKRG